MPESYAQTRGVRPWSDAVVSAQQNAFDSFIRKMAPGRKIAPALLRDAWAA